MKKIPLFLILIALLGLETLVVLTVGIGSILVLGISIVLVVLGGGGVVLAWVQFSGKKTEKVGTSWVEPRNLGAQDTLENSPLETQAPTSPKTPCPKNEPATWTRETDVYEKALPALFQSITDYLNKTSEPMSESLVTIKSSMKDFIAQVHAHDEEITQASSLDAITGNVDRLQEHINHVAQESTQAFVVFGKEFQRLKDLLTSIFKLTGNISEIAERVHVLSINASIESARAGIHGRGFKVIAGEIQKLAHETQTFLKDIGGTVETSKDIFTSIDQEIDHNRTQMIHLVQKEKATFDSLNQTITRHYGQFKNLYSGILEFVSGLEGKMNNIFPVAMLLAIIIQEIENLHLVTGDFVLLLRDLFTNPDGMCRDFDPVATVERLRKRLTTARELDALESVVKILGLQGKVDLNRNKNDYEMF